QNSAARATSGAAAGRSFSVTPPVFQKQGWFFTPCDGRMGAEQEREEGTTVGIRATVGLEPWGPRDLPVLERSNAPAMTLYLGGPESAEKLATRHAKYL